MLGLGFIPAVAHPLTPWLLFFTCYAIFRSVASGVRSRTSGSRRSAACAIRSDLVHYPLFILFSDTLGGSRVSHRISRSRSRVPS